MRWNPHFHAIVLEGGFDSEGTFFYLPFWGLDKITELFRRRIFNLFLEKKLINESFARNMLSWKHSQVQSGCRAEQHSGSYRSAARNDPDKPQVATRH